MSEKTNRRDAKLEAHGIRRKDWVAQAIALAGMHGTGARRGKRARKREEKPEPDEIDDAEDSGSQE